MLRTALPIEVKEMDHILDKFRKVYKTKLDSIFDRELSKEYLQAAKKRQPKKSPMTAPRK